MNGRERAAAGEAEARAMTGKAEMQAMTGEAKTRVMAGEAEARTAHAARPWEKNIRRVTPYVPGEQPQGGRLIKLNTNENPYPPSPAVREVLKAMEPDMLRKYPDPSASALVNALAGYYGLNPEGGAFRDPL